MSDTDPTIAQETLLHEGWSRLLRLGIRLPGGEMVQREVLERGPAAAVLPFDPDRRTVILVRQFRAPVLHAGGPARLLEAIAGVLDGDGPEECARREAHEEAGLRLSALEKVAAAYPAPGSSTELIHLFLAAYGPADRIGAGGGLAEEHEDIEVVEMPAADLWRLLQEGGIGDLKTLALVQALGLRRPELFELRQSRP
jgi:nudix-type nucleoside diphosphatase (YffH/AdpP family)